ncbi:hypothetical protein [Enterococcus termitis]|uniref:hypothetical protein n=1 Tax=Enterococcus termitis TaxID=332950 RepID=UPI000922D5F7|nr:hypothetical protein [Enterococcus termitis]OJG97508.1 hypothetical protein RV18_GL000789 [Enterococcus termitis]
MHPIHQIILRLVFLSVSLSGCSSKFGKEKSSVASSSSSTVKITKSSSSQTQESTHSNTSSSITKQSVNQDNNNRIDDSTQSTSEQNVVNEAQLQPTSEQDETNTDWKNKFENTLYENYKVTVKEYVDYGNGYFGVFVNEVDTGDNAYVTVNSATGNFHG